jgi:TonB family protein
MPMRFLLPAAAVLAMAGATPLAAQKPSPARKAAAPSASAPAAAPSPCTGDCPPRILNEAEIEREVTRQYPPLLRDAGVGGTVVVQLTVDSTGTVVPGSLRVVRQEHPEFDAPALRVLAGMRFSPARLNGEAVPVTIEIPLTFSAR